MAAKHPTGPPGAHEQTKTVDAKRQIEVQYSVIVSTDTGVLVHTFAASKPLVLGRSSDCDVVIDDPSVSRRHAAIHFSPALCIEDLGSHNGTMVQRRRITGGARVPIDVGTFLELGSVSVVLEHGRQLLPHGKRAASPTPAEVIVRDHGMRRLYAMLDVIAPSDLSVLLLGETGVGKDVLATELHRRSRRSAAPFLAINCAALPESIVEAVLFGYDKGAFTGAAQDKPGLFEAASGGTVFLDEVGELPLPTQPKLLRVLETREVTRLGSVRPTPIDVRFLSATNRDLGALAASGAFRSDLLFRLDGITLTLPPLRERIEEIVPLAEHFVQRAAARAGRAAPRLTPGSQQQLESYRWPGNVRELRSVIDRAVVLCRGETIDPENLMMASSLAQASEGGTPPADAGASELRTQMAQFERQRVVDALEQSQGNQTRAAKLLGVSRRTLINKLEAYGIDRPRRRDKDK